MNICGKTIMKISGMIYTKLRLVVASEKGERRESNGTGRYPGNLKGNNSNVLLLNLSDEYMNICCFPILNILRRVFYK